MIWDWQFAWDVFPEIALNGLRITIVATVLGSLLAYTLGLVLTLLRRSPIRASAPAPGHSSSSSAAPRCWCRSSSSFSYFPTSGCASTR